jgi:hypothetical protein
LDQFFALALQHEHLAKLGMSRALLRVGSTSSLGDHSVDAVMIGEVP